MSTRFVICGCMVLSAVLSTSFGQQASGLKALYDAHDWSDLYRRLQNESNAPSLYRAAVNITFNQHPEESERLLFSVISKSPHSPEAYEGFEWLSHLYLYSGRYRSLVATMERRWAAFPEKPERAQEQAQISGLRGLPDQMTGSSRPSILKHEPDSIFIPLSINGASAAYFFDTGAWISCMSESEVKRLHLKLRNSSGTSGQSAGSQVAFRTTVATNVTIGKTHFKDVSFAVFPDSQEPWVDLAVERKGIIGMPMLVGLKTLRWHKAGNIELAKESQPFNVRDANLSFDNDHLAVSASVQGEKVSATVDTGAVSTDLYQPFADKFGDLLKKAGKSGATEVRGVGHAESFPSITLPKLNIRVGDADTVLSPAHVLLKSIGAGCCVGNFGMDLFKQSAAMDIDLGAMSLRLRPAQ